MWNLSLFSFYLGLRLIKVEMVIEEFNNSVIMYVACCYSILICHIKKRKY